MADPITFPSTTTNFEFPLLFSGQAQKEFFLNQSISLIDAMLAATAVQTIGSPPASPTEGECYIVDPTPSGDWAGHQDQIAIRIGGDWHFVPPHDGMSVFDQDAGVTKHYDGGWVAASQVAQPTGGSSVDAEARAAISALLGELRKLGILPNLP